MKPTPLTARTARARAKAALTRHERKKHVLTGGHDVPHAKRWDCTKSCAVYHAEWSRLNVGHAMRSGGKPGDVPKFKPAEGQDFRDTPTFLPDATKAVRRHYPAGNWGVCVVLVGDIVSGFDAYGPFESGHDAVTWHQQKGNRELTQGQWFIMPLKVPHERSEEPTRA